MAKKSPELELITGQITKELPQVGVRMITQILRYIIIKNWERMYNNTDQLVDFQPYLINSSKSNNYKT